MARLGPIAVFGAIWRIVLRVLGLHLLQALPLAVLATAALFPLTWAWTSFVTGSHWWSKGVIVETESGYVRGFTQEKVNYFLGVPYAAPPLGELRFRAPKPALQWDRRKPYQATTFRAECMQGKLHNTDRPKLMSEDCLFLNIWVPTSARKKKPVPVMVWIYGGAFQQGGSSKVEYYGQNLASKGVVVVSCNYRLGVLGFMVSIEDGLYGNYGLQDQRMCLEWVQRNIRNFGGDPGSVTLFGESAGAMSVGQHLLMDGPGKLFHRAIMQSNPYSYQYRSMTVANFLGQAVKRGIDCSDLKCMQEEPVTEILDVQDSLHGMPRSVGDFFTWGPVERTGPFWAAAEASARREVPITVRQPLKVMDHPNFVNTIPVMLGSCKDEGHMFVYNVFPFPLPKYLYWTFVGLLFKESAPRIVRHYNDMAERTAKPVNATRSDYRPVLSSILNDYMFRCPTWRAAHLLQEKSRPGVDVYVFQFSHPTRVPNYPECHGLSCHTAELPYVFNNLDVIHQGYAMGCEERNSSTVYDFVSNLLWNLFFKADVDEKLAEVMSGHWLAFAKTSDPNYPGAHLQWRQWKGKRRYHTQENPVEPDIEGQDWPYMSQDRRGRMLEQDDMEQGRKGKGRNKGRVKAAQEPLVEPHYLELKWKPEQHLATRDCTCDFWDNIGYRY